MAKIQNVELPYLTFDEAASPGTPASGAGYIYVTTGGTPTFVNDAGTETSLLASGGAVATDAIWDAKGDLAVGTGANTAQKLTKGTDGYVLTADSAETTGLKWAAAGGGATASYLGYNTVGGTSFAVTGNTIYWKQITPANDCILVGVQVYCKANAEGVNPSIFGSVNTDNSGNPALALAYGTGAPLMDSINGAGGINNPRWISIPIGGVYLTASTAYWIAVGANPAYVDFYKDGSGSDKTTAASGLYGDAGYFTITGTTDKYSIRALVIDL